MRDLAGLAGVSVMTVSRSLRNSPKISEKTKKRVVKIAEENGYSVNPLVAAQMASIRAKRLVKYKATLGLVVYTPSEGAWVGSQKIIKGIIESCEAMGFGCDLFDLADEELTASRLDRMLSSRGIQGVIEAPMLYGLSNYDIDFSRLIVVGSTPGTLPQTFHRVCPDHYGNMDMLLRKLYDHGYRSPGLMVTRDVDSRFNHLWSSRFLAFQQTEGLAKIPLHMPETRSRFDKQGFIQWLNTYKPDVLIATNQELFEERFFEKAGIRIPEDIEVVKININDTTKGFSGVNVMSEEVGKGCVKLVSQLMYQNEYGKPDKPISILVPGEWEDGSMCPSLVSNRLAEV